jgi:hypothetical protein
MSEAAAAEVAAAAEADGTGSADGEEPNADVVSGMLEPEEW